MSKSLKKKTPVKKKAAPKKKAAVAKAVRFEVNDPSKVVIDFDIRFTAPGGSIHLAGEGVHHTSTATDHFTGLQSKGAQSVQVGGIVPTMPGGKIEVQVSQNRKILSPYSQHSFTTSPFNSAVNYTVQ